MMNLVKNFHTSKEIVSKYFILLSHPQPPKKKSETAPVTINSGSGRFIIRILQPYYLIAAGSSVSLSVSNKNSHKFKNGITS
jgi:hypothetical protein